MSNQGRSIAITTAIAVAVLAGCAQSQEPLQNSTAEVSMNRASASVPSGAPHIPLRIGREFFERDVEAQVSVTPADSTEGNSIVSDISWEEGAPIGPAPGPGALADFRDRPGCARLTEQSSVQVCFVVVPDVSSLDVTAQKVSLKGFESISTGCAGAPKAIKFIEGRKEENALSLYFQADYGAECSLQMITVKLNAA
jgi:hypothetical protein